MKHVIYLFENVLSMAKKAETPPKGGPERAEEPKTQLCQNRTYEGMRETICAIEAEFALSCKGSPVERTVCREHLVAGVVNMALGGVRIRPVSVRLLGVA